MKTIILMLCLVGQVPVADNVSVAGKWHVHMTIAGNDSDADCTFVQKDADLTGTCAIEQGSVALTGKVAGKKITWSYKSEYNGSPLTVSFDGQLGGENKITGTASVPEYSVDGDFTATQAK